MHIYSMVQSDSQRGIGSRWILRRVAVLVVAASLTAGAAHEAARAQGGAAPKVANAVAGEAVRLRTSWVAGERLSYEMRIDGTANMQASPNAGSALAGIPLDIEVKGSGTGAMEALSVDESGTARVVPSLSALKLRAESFGQRFDVTLANERFVAAFNGQTVGRGDKNDKNGAFLSNPPFALEITDRGRIAGALPRDAEGNVREVKEDGAATAAADAKADAPNVPGLDWGRLAQSMLWRAIPTLWPATAVKAGDSWNSEVTMPLPDATAPNGLALQQLGRFDFTMRGVEDVAGKRVARVSIKGGLELDNKVAKSIGDAVKKEGDQVAPGAARRAGDAAKKAATKKGDFDTVFDRASQRVEGDLWVDPQNGHIVRAEVTLETQTASHETVRAGAKPRAKPGDSFFDFSGTLQLQLKDRTVKPAA
jgi:hypothetical protein